MNEKIENLVLEQPRAIRADIGRLFDEMRSLKAEMISVKLHTRGIEVQQDADHTDIATRKTRVDRIERRLELADADETK